MTKLELIKVVAQAVRTAYPDRDVSTVMVENVLDALGDWPPPSCWAVGKSRCPVSASSRARM